MEITDTETKDRDEAIYLGKHDAAIVIRGTDDGGMQGSMHIYISNESAEDEPVDTASYTAVLLASAIHYPEVIDKLIEKFEEFEDEVLNEGVLEVEIDDEGEEDGDDNSNSNH